MKPEDQTIFRAVNCIPRINVIHNEYSEYAYPQVVSPWKTTLESSGQGTSGKRMGRQRWREEGVSWFNSIRKKKAYNRNKAIKTNQTHFLSPSLWTGSFEVHHVRASKRKRRVTIITSGENSQFKDARCTQPWVPPHSTEFTPPSSTGISTADKFYLENIYIIPDYTEKVHVTVR